MMRSMRCLFICAMLGLSACSETPATDQAVLEAIGPKEELSIFPSGTQVAEFTAKNTDFKVSYDKDECSNITPDFIAAHSDFAVFKYDTSTETFIMYEDEIYSIGPCVGGYGITSMALGDLNRDGQWELYYTFSWGSGRHRSQIGYFDSVSRETTVFEYSLFDCDMMVTVNDDGDLCVNRAELDMDSFVDFSVRAQELVGRIEAEGDKITLKEFGNQEALQAGTERR